jgi:hydrogenase maturation protease
MNRILVAGVGSAHGDDALGWMVIDGLFSCASSPWLASIQLTKLQTPLDLLGVIDPASETPDQAFDVCILIDACLGLAAGGLQRWKWPDLPSEVSSATSTHRLGLVSSLELAESLEVLPEQTWVYGVQVDDLQTSVACCIEGLLGHLPELLGLDTLGGNWVERDIGIRRGSKA